MLGWVAWTMIFCGMWMVGNKHRFGFIWSIGGGCLLTVHATLMQDWSLVVANAAFMTLYLRNWWRWRDNDEDRIRS